MEKIFANHISDKRLVSRIYKEPLKLNNKKTDNPVKKYVKYEQIIHQRQYRWYMKKHMKRCSISYVIREMQIKK